MATPVRAWRLLDGRNHKNQHRNELGFDTFSAARTLTTRSSQSAISDFQISRFPDFQISRFPDFQISRFPDFQISRFPDFQISRFPDFQILAVNANQDAPPLALKPSDAAILIE
jgi:hypothetical protein